jgi:hypothetical protein
MHINLMALWSSDAPALTEKERRCVVRGLMRLKNCGNKPEHIDKIAALVCEDVKAVVGNEELMFKVMVDELDFEINLFRAQLFRKASYLKGACHLALGAAMAYALYCCRQYSFEVRKQVEAFGIRNIRCSGDYCTGDMYYFGSRPDPSTTKKAKSLLGDLAYWEGFRYYQLMFLGGLASIGSLITGITDLNREMHPDFYHKNYSLVRDSFKKRIAVCNGDDSVVSAAE